MKKHYLLLYLFVMPFILFVVVLPIMPLMEPDEARYALIPREMNERGDYITPHLKGVTYLEKPPLVYWLEAICFRLFGESEFSARLPSGLSAWGLVLLIYVIGSSLKDKQLGLVSAAVFSVSLLPFVLARINILDMPLTFFISLAVWSGYRYLTLNRNRWWLYGLYFFSACAFLVKGVVGVFFPFSILILWLVWIKSWRKVPSLFSPMGLMILAILIGPWLWAVQKANPEFLEFFFLREHILRYTTTIHERGEPIYYFLPVLLVGALPWWLYFLGRGRFLGAKEIWHLVRREDKLKFLMLWILWPLFFFSFSSSKLVPYILPLFPPLAVFFAILLLYRPKNGEAPEINLGPYLSSLIFIAVVFVPFFVPTWKNTPPLAWPYYALPITLQIFILFFSKKVEKSDLTSRYLIISFAHGLYLVSLLPVCGHYLAPIKSACRLAQAVDKFVPPGEMIYQFRTILYGLDFYTGKRTAIVDEQGELAAGVKKISSEERRRYFPLTSEVMEELRRGHIIYAVTDKREKLMGLEQHGASIEVLWDNGKYYMYRVRGQKKGDRCFPATE
ncbi:MAG: glycosyltransferase family 39 protein [Syntrophales bacterium]|nr:glycosyltransferase family 39 protein [Syntrophales bacterium]